MWTKITHATLQIRGIKTLVFHGPEHEVGDRDGGVRLEAILLHIYTSIHLSIYLSFCLSFYLSLYKVWGWRVYGPEHKIGDGDGGVRLEAVLLLHVPDRLVEAFGLRVQG